MRLKNVFVAMTFAVSMWAADPGVGVWKINIEKSKLANPASRSWDETTVVAVGSNGYRMTYTLHGKPSGYPTHTLYFDGKEEPVGWSSVWSEQSVIRSV